MTTSKQIPAAILFLGLLGTACSDNGEEPSDPAGGAGSGGSAAGASGKGGSTSKGGGSGSGGTSPSGGGGSGGGGSSSGGSGSGGETMDAECTPDPEPPADFSQCLELEGYPVPPRSFTLPTPMVAGAAYAVMLDVAGDGTPDVEIWGTSSECGTPLEELAPPQPRTAGSYCLELQPTAAHSHVLVIQTGDAFGTGSGLQRVCAGGSCP